MKYIIKQIINRNTGGDVCLQYLNQPIKEVVYKIGESLKVKYESGGFFAHENVKHIEKQGNSLRMVTDNKIWILEEVNFSDILRKDKFKNKTCEMNASKIIGSKMDSSKIMLSYGK